jgi:hypothetical protein
MKIRVCLSEIKKTKIGVDIRVKIVQILKKQAVNNST